jgi:hypothetical protein
MRPPRFLALFFGLLWHEVEPKSCGIPDPYRAKGCISAKDAWEIAWRIWMTNRRAK